MGIISKAFAITLILVGSLTTLGLLQFTLLFTSGSSGTATCISFGSAGAICFNNSITIGFFSTMFGLLLMILGFLLYFRGRRH